MITKVGRVKQSPAGRGKQVLLSFCYWFGSYVGVCLMIPEIVRNCVFCPLLSASRSLELR